MNGVERNGDIDSWAERVFGKRVPQSRRIRLRDDKAAAKAEFDRLFTRSENRKSQK